MSPFKIDSGGKQGSAGYPDHTLLDTSEVRTTNFRGDQLDAKAEESFLVQACLNQRPFAWQQFVDRFLPVVLKAVHEIDNQSSRGWSETEHHDMARSVFEQLKENDFRLLRDWDAANDFETWLIIVARRVAIGPGGENQDPGSNE